MRRPSFLLVLFLFSGVMALPLKATLQQGKTFGQQMLTQSGNGTTKVKPGEVVPQYTARPAEAGLDASSLNEKKIKDTLATHSSATLISESSQSRGKFLNLQEDPLLTFSRDLSKDPLALLSRFYKDCREVPLEGSALPLEKEQMSCEEAGGPYTLTCTRDLHVETIKKEKKYHRSHLEGVIFKRYTVKGNPQYSCSHVSRMGHDRRYNFYVVDPSLKDMAWRFHDGANPYGHWVTNDYTYHKGFAGSPQKTITLAEYNNTVLGAEDTRETWTSNCALIEEKADSGLCQYVKKACTQGAQTRLINGFAVSKPCWQETYTYQCIVPARNDCDRLRARGCAQLRSDCTQFMGKDCVLYKQTFECLKPSTQQGKGAKTRIVCGEAPQCFSGDCVEQGYPLNGEMLQVMSQMSVLKELQNQIKEGMPQIFKGEDNRCRRNIADFKDCCGSDGGWGTSVGLASTCSFDEKQLKIKRQKKQCHRLGTYCSNKVLGLCLEKTTTFCCFGSSFLRTLQEQARNQIGLGWGGAENPVCRGLTVEELSRVDFSKLDLSEIFQGISARYKQPQSAVMGKKIQSRMEEIQETLKKDPYAKQGEKG